MDHRHYHLYEIPFVKIVRSGLLMMIPILTVGSMALILRSLPITVYQTFLQQFANGLLFQIFSFIYNATFGMLSIYMVLFLSYCTAKQKQETESALGCVSSGLASFLLSVGFLTSSFELSSFSAVGMFTAILCGTLAPMLYLCFSKRIRFVKVFLDGSEPMYNNAIATLFPLALVCLLFAIINAFIGVFFHVNNFWQLFASAVNLLFSAIGLNFFGGMLYILLSSFMWFFGIHGSDVLESVTTHLLEPAMELNIAAVAMGSAPAEIFTKTFFDVFVLMGGCGSALALLLALLLFSKRKSSRSLAKLAAVPMFFNINELMVFGLPIVYNPILFVPFLLAPFVCFLTSTAAMLAGIVPLTTKVVAWTTPIFLGGYQSTGSIAGSFLQLFNLALATLIYMPFVRRYDAAKEAENKENIDLLIAKFKANEASNQNSLLTDEGGVIGGIAKQLVNDLHAAVIEQKLYLVYQPQNNATGACIGCEALLRYQHPVFGMIYPPLIIKLAAEGGFLSTLEEVIFLQVKEDMKEMEGLARVNINVTAFSLQQESFQNFLQETFPQGQANHIPICIEITEQSELVTSEAMIALLSKLRKHGFPLSIDDFSMGYTSLKYLQECCFDQVKLDGSLIRGMIDSFNTRNIISSIVYLSQSMHFSVLAEFVETIEQQQLLASIGCYEYQGYLYSKPLSKEEMVLYYKENQTGDRKK